MATARQQINVEASPRVVWRAFTTDEGLASWFVDEARVAAQKGGRVVLTTEDDEGNPLQEAGVFMEYRPTRRLVLKFDTGSTPFAGSRLELIFARDGEETRVSAVHYGLADETVDGIDREWRGALRTLRDVLEA